MFQTRVDTRDGMLVARLSLSELYCAIYIQYRVFIFYLYGTVTIICVWHAKLCLDMGVWLACARLA